MLAAQRRSVNAAAAPHSGLGGQELEFSMMIADGSKTGKADPAFEAHTSVAQHWAQAVWNSWMPEEDLQASIDYARSRIDKAQQPWSVVTGPAAALVCTLDRLQWRVVSAVLLITDEGREVDLRITPPIVVKKMVEAAVRRWRWRNVAEAHPSLHKGCNFEPIFKLIGSKRNDEGWNPFLRGMLKSVVANRQFPQSRCHQAGWVQHPKCIFCLHTEVTGEQLHAKLCKERSVGTAGDHDRDKGWQRQPGGQVGKNGERKEEPMHTKATAEQIEASPNGTLAHRNYCCKALGGERSKHAPAALVQAAREYANGNLAFERALHPSIAHTVPHPRQWKLLFDGSSPRQEGPLRARSTRMGRGWMGPLRCLRETVGGSSSLMTKGTP